MASLTARGTHVITRLKGESTATIEHSGRMRWFHEFALRSDGKILRRCTHTEYLDGLPFPMWDALKSNPNKVPTNSAWSVMATLPKGETPDQWTARLTRWVNKNFENVS